MANLGYFNDFSPCTTSISMANIPYVAGLLKSTMMGYKYASNCPWYDKLTSAKSVKEIFDVFGIQFELRENRFFPVIKNVEVNPTYKDVLKAIAKYMENGEMFVKDDFRYYTLSFKDGNITGKRTTPSIPDTTPVQNTPVKANKATKGKAKKEAPKKYAKTEVRSDTSVSSITARANNTYTVQELTQELIRQILNGNGNKQIEVKADFLFKDAEQTA